MRSELSFSIIISSHNYERFVAAAIESALAIDWPDVEVIVVDDGSTDGSRDVIAGFGNRVRAIFQPQSGQRVANNAGLAASRGDVVIFLDSDDLLEPGIACEIAAVWTPLVSKVQVQMMRIAEDGTPLGSVIPRLSHTPTPREVRRWAQISGDYPTPPGSGNAYARRFLDRLFPIGPERDSSTDTTCIAMAPFLGDVVTIARPLARYRCHGANDSDLLSDERRFAREVVRASSRLRAGREAAALAGCAPPPASALFRSTHLLQLRIASLRLRPADHPLAQDSRARALRDALLTPLRAGFEPGRFRLLISGWALLALLAPDALARRLIRWRFGLQARARARLAGGRSGAEGSGAAPPSRTLPACVAARSA